MPYLSKQTVLVIAALTLSGSVFSQYNEWTWMKGSNTTNALAVYGTQGTANIANTPDASYEAIEWTDNTGIFWLLTEYGEFWKYDPTTNMWTWMDTRAENFGVQGIPSVNNYPGGHGYGALTWTDNNNDLWLYAGTTIGWDSNLWRYNIGSNTWTWMKGTGTCLCFAPVYGIKGVAASTNEPGSRAEVSCSWKDAAGNLWFFGGQACIGACTGGAGNNGGLSDLWKYDVGTNNWTWMGGPTAVDQPAVYGAQGVTAPANIPSGRFAYASGQDNSGNFYLFGGENYFIGGGELSDLWKYDPISGLWTWLSGSNQQNQPAIYGTKCIENVNNRPGTAKEQRIRWTDDCGNLWTFSTGGMGISTNDLWRYSIKNNTWTWVSGTNLGNQPGVYGAMGVSAPTNIPGTRKGGNAWRTASDFYLFGGINGSGDKLNDLWRYKPDKPIAGFTASSPGGCAPVTINFTNTSTPGCNEIKSYLWNFGGGVNDTSSFINPSHTYTTNGTYTVSLLVVNCTGTRDSTTQTINIGSMAITITSSQVSCNLNDATATVNPTSGTSPFTYNWSNGQATSTATGLSAGNYSVTVADASGCSITQTVTITSSSTLSVTATSTPAGCTLNNGTASASPSSGITPYTYNWSNGQTTQTVTGLGVGNYTVTVTDGNGCTQTQSISVTQIPGPTATASASSSVITSGESSTLTATGGGTYLWSPTADLSCATCANPTATPLQTTPYCVLVTDNNGCQDSACIIITIDIPCGIIYIPNAFSPNNDLENDLECVFGNCMETFHLQIYNRWGELIFESNDQTLCWDGTHKGKLLNTAVFDYYFEATLTSGEKVNKKGNISLVR